MAAKKHNNNMETKLLPNFLIFLLQQLVVVVSGRDTAPTENSVLNKKKCLILQTYPVSLVSLRIIL